MKIGFLYPAFQNLGIEYLSAMVRQNGHETFLAFDPQLFDDLYLSWRWVARVFSYRQRLIDQLKREQPDLMAVSVVSDLYPWACGFAEQIKRELGDVPIVFGGPHVTAVPDRVLKHPAVDYVVVGEGEYAFAELVDCLDRGLPIDRIEGLGFKRNGAIVVNEPRPLIQDLDALPYPDVDLFLDQNPYGKREYNIITARGCVGSCAYCHNSVDRKLLWRNRGKFLRRRSMDNIIDELVQRKAQYGFDTLCIWDEVFTVDVEWLEEFCGRYKREVGVPFWTFVHPNHITERTVEILEDAGCWEVEMGVQTLNPRVKRELLNRPESKEAVERAIRLLRSSKIRVVADVIFGLPVLTEDDYIELLETFNQYVPTKIQTFWLRYYPRTDIVDPALEMGLLTPEDVEAIEHGLVACAAASGGSGVDPRYVKYQTLLTLLPYLPRSVVQKLIERPGLRRLLPSVSGFGHLFTRLFDVGNRNDAGARRYKSRKLYFTSRKLLPVLDRRPGHGRERPTKRKGGARRGD